MFLFPATLVVYLLTVAVERGLVCSAPIYATKSKETDCNCSATIIETIYIIIFGLATVGLEFQTPPQVARYASFMFSFIGRGVCMSKNLFCVIGFQKLMLVHTVYIFVGTVMLGPDANVLGYIFGSIVALLGAGYIVLEFLPQIEPPANMREADAGWGAEQV